MSLYKSFLSKRLILGLLSLFSLASFNLLVQAQEPGAGSAILKNVVGPDGTARAHVGDVVTATLKVINLDDFSDLLSFTNVSDVVHHAQRPDRADHRTVTPQL